MTLTELRNTFASVSEAVPVPTPDPGAFERRVTAVRRRRTAGRVTGAIAAVAVVATGSPLALSLGDQPTERTAPAHETPAQAPHWVPVLVEGHLHIVDKSGVMGAEGPAVSSIVGTTPHGVVVLTEDGTLSRLGGGAEQLQQLVPGRVRTAYLDGTAVAYEDQDALIHWWGIEPTVSSTDSAQTEDGRLMGAGDSAVVIEGGPDHGLQVWSADGQSPLPLDPAVIELLGVDVASGTIAVRTDLGVEFFDTAGTALARADREGIGSLAPDGGSYAQQSASREAVELVDPRTAAATPVDGPSGPVVDVGWAPDGDLLTVVQNDDATNTLWRCSPAGTGCAPQVDDPTGTLRLR